MLRKVGALSVLLFALAPILTPAAASTTLPDILVGSGNATPQCVTPGRLMVYLRTRNPQLDTRAYAAWFHETPLRYRNRAAFSS